MQNLLTGHLLTERSQSQINKQHNEIEFLDWSFDFMKISQNRNHVFLLRSTFFINNFRAKNIYKEIVFCNLKNLEKVKSELEEIEFHYVVPYF